MFIKALFESETRLLNTAHIHEIRPYFATDGESGARVASGCEVRMTGDRRFFIGNDFADIQEQLNNL